MPKAPAPAMRGFTLWEPWATFMAWGYKKNETRTWHTKYRGPLVIHAAKTAEHLYDVKFIMSTAGVIESAFDPVPEGFPVDDAEWPLGKILGVCNLVDCVPTDDVRKSLSRMERALGDYSSGRYAWITEDFRKVDPPIPWRGSQGFWRPSPEVIERLSSTARGAPE